MPPATGAKAKSAASQAVQPRVFAMLVLEGEETKVHVEDAETVKSHQYHVKRVFLLDGHFTDADLRAWALDIQTGRCTSINAHIKCALFSEDHWPEMSRYITEGWAMILENEHSAIVSAIQAAVNGWHAMANSIMANCRMLP